MPLSFTPRIHQTLAQLSDKTLPKQELDCLLFDLITECWRLTSHTQQQIDSIQAVKKSTREELYKRLLLAHELMQGCSDQPLTLQQIAQQVCLNKFHLLVSFKQLYHITPNQYLIAVRLQKAVDLLQTNQYSVSEVGSLVGFESLASFSHAFKKKYGQSPSHLVQLG